MGLGPNVGGWQMDNAAIQTVLESVGAEAESLGEVWTEGKISSVTALDFCDNDGGQIGVITEAALQEFMGAGAIMATNIVQRITAGIYGVAAAATEYAQADVDMSALADAQTEMTASASSGDFAYFENTYGFGQ